MTDWIKDLHILEENKTSFVLITVIEIKGSTPRNTGTKMIVTEGNIHGTIGGGHLEFKAMEIARSVLQKKEKQTPFFEEFPLGPKLGQCCGGFAKLLFEPIFYNQLPVVIFGAGHVGKALVNTLSPLPCQIYWIDARESEFPKNIPTNVSQIVDDCPTDLLKNFPDNSYYLIMTHNHALDLDLVEAVLKHNQFSYLGLIGSKTKVTRFKNRLTRKGFSDKDLQQITCPIGISGISGKHPYEIAISVSAEILQRKELNNG